MEAKKIKSIWDGVSLSSKTTWVGAEDNGSTIKEVLTEIINDGTVQNKYEPIQLPSIENYEVGSSSKWPREVPKFPESALKMEDMKVHYVGEPIEIAKDEADKKNEKAEALKKLLSQTIEAESVEREEDEPLFSILTGRAGTGKSTQTQMLMQSNPRKYEVGSTTGIAAINMGTRTINSILKYFDTKSLENSHRQGILQNILRQIRRNGKRMLIIDEMSMLAAKQLDIIYDAICQINNDYSSRGNEFGLRLCGDFVQLPPINEEFCFKAYCWDEFAKNTTRLEKIWRQDNPDFINAINEVRNGDNGKLAVEMLKACGVKFQKELSKDFDGTTIISINDKVDSYNKERLEKINSPIIRVTPTKRGTQAREWEGKKDRYGKIKGGLIPHEMRFKIGAYVVILANDIPDFKYANGDCGTIIRYDSKADVFYIRLKRTDEVVKVGKIKRCNFLDKEPDDSYKSSMFIPYKDYQTENWVVGTVEYHPIRLAFATTVHKCIKEDSFVFTRAGLKRVKDLDVESNEQLYNGEVQQKLLAKEESLQDALKITTSCGYEIICSPEHRFPMKYFLRQAKDLQVGDRLFISGNNHTDFEYLIDSDFAWLLGILVGDGSYRDKRDGTIQVCSIDADIQNEAARIVNSYGVNYHFRKDERGGYFISKKFRKFLLEEFDLDYTLAIDKEIPTKIFTAQESAKANFLAGLWDSDGCIKANSFVFTSGSTKLAKQVQLLLLDLGIMSKLCTMHTTDNHRRGYYHQLLVSRTFHKLFQEKIHLRLKRKWEIIKRLKDPKQNRLAKYKNMEDDIVSIEYLNEKVPMIDIEVEGNNLFIANGIVTHNSQGLSLDLIQVDVRDRFFSNPSMAYVALSRARTPEGLIIVGSEGQLASAIKTSKEVRAWL